MDGKFRTFRKDIENVMLWENEVTEAINIIKARKQTIFPLADKLTVMEKTGKSQVQMNALLMSMIHMTMNRWFRTKNRLHELVIYDFMSRYYTGEIAKKKYNK